jgi:lipopolysaccharide/colanic/teichoic acid biosynthesis glycosyltransferase
MNLLLIHGNTPTISDIDNNGNSLLRFALCDGDVSRVVLDGLDRCMSWKNDKSSILRFFGKSKSDGNIYAIPEKWSVVSDKKHYQKQTPQSSFSSSEINIIPYLESVPICPELLKKAKQNPTLKSWFVISNGQFATQINNALLEKILTSINADVVAINVKSKLLGEKEKIRLTSQGVVAGLRRLYYDSAELTLVSNDWPHHLFIRTDVLDLLLIDGALCSSFSVLMDMCRSNNLTLHAINMGGSVLDLETENGLLSFCMRELARSQKLKPEVRNSNMISEDSRLVGKVLLGKNIQIGPRVVIAGPAIIGDDVKIEQGVIINSSIIGQNVSIPKNQLIQNCVIKDQKYDWKCRKNNVSKRISYLRSNSDLFRSVPGPFRSWPKLSYARCFKRIADFIAAVIVLVLFAPLMPFVALAIKLNSVGPVFFKDKRQGLHGKKFNCLKFRTMITGADKIQEKLRIASHVDGPQFKMEDDPRISLVGRFLRETYIDEIPQFFNVLLGQMSVVGPRPSPESENTLCPFWRDARLSVRPGITGLWQVYRTRQPMKDFQEWIHYDIEYVRNLSLIMDLNICWQTTKKMLGSFINQF